MTRVLWFTGLSGSGKSTLSLAVAAELVELGVPVSMLDADDLRRGLCADLGFGFDDRVENIRRIAHVAELLAKDDNVVLVAAISPFQVCRDMARLILPNMIEVFVDAPLAICEARDPKSLYKKARAGLLPNFTGVDSPYEIPPAPDVTCHTDREPVGDCVSKIMQSILDQLPARAIESTIVREKMRERSPCIAVDFDGVIADYEGWKGETVLGQARADVVLALTQLKREGWKVVVHTTRGAEAIARYLEDMGVPFDEINKNSDFSNAGPKPVATVYWDDRAVRYTGDALRDLDRIRAFRTWSGRK